MKSIGLKRTYKAIIVAVYSDTGTKLVTYRYDAWGQTTFVYSNGGSTTKATLNPFRYRGYYYDTDTEFYYLQSRYYDPVTGRFINPDSMIAGLSGSLHGYNLFAYCFNNPVNAFDQDGQWPKWLNGALTCAGGVMQLAAGAALGATVGWTGFGAVVATFLLVNGSATASQGVSQIYNDVTNSDYLREDNVARTLVQETGRSVAGDTGATVAGGAYDIAVVAANLYAGKVGLQQVGKLPVKVNINNLVNNSLDEFVQSGPANGVISQYCRSIPQQGYGKIYATSIGNGIYQIANGHHRVAALRALGYETIWIFLTK